jgi:hypothetical protein
LAPAYGWGRHKGEMLMQVKDVINVVKTLVDAAKPIIEAIQQTADKLGK